MKKMKRVIALLMTLAMIMPAQTILASSLPEETLAIDEIWEDSEAIKQETELTGSTIDEIESVSQETKPDETTIDRVDSDGQETEVAIKETTHYQETVTLEPLKPIDSFEWDGELTIYWNPASDDALIKDLPIASPSQATRANALTDTIGSDHADGLTPATAVRSLNTAIRRAEKLSRLMDVEVSDITILAMSPMIIPQGVMYTVRGRGVHIAAWESRGDNSGLIFAVDGGQLTLHNLVLQPQDAGTAPEDAELIYIKSGKVQLGEKVESYGSFVLDFGQEYNLPTWSSLSQAEASESEAGVYTEPIIELLKRFEPASDYFLQIKVDDNRENITAVHALFADSKTTDEFMEAFVLVENNAQEWSLFVEERIGGVLRDTTEEGEEEATESETTLSEVEKLRGGMQKKEDSTLTQKSLIATRAIVNERSPIYWNPGGEIIVPGDNMVYPAGDDTNNDGFKEVAPIRSWYVAREKALTSGGTIICMQTIDLSTAGLDTMMFKKEDIENGISAEYLDDDGNFVLDGVGDTRVTLSSWNKNRLPVLKIPDDTSVVLKNLTLLGDSSSSMVLEGGQLIVEENVYTESGFIQMNMRESTKVRETPAIINSSNVGINFYFGGINQDISWRYQDVIIAGDDLIAEMGGDEQAGDKLLQIITLDIGNIQTIEEGGSSRFKWELRKDTDEDLSGVVNPSHLELYTMYYFDAVYLDGVRGEDTNYGATCNFPVKSFDKAKQILIAELEKSLAKRVEVYGNGGDWTRYDLPLVLYICGTVEVKQAENWSLPEHYVDADGTPIRVEIKTHMDAAVDDTLTKFHETPTTLIHVTGSSGDLTLGSGILIRNLADLRDRRTYTIAVDESAMLHLQSNAELTGLKDSGDIESRTLGVHILLGKDPISGAETAGDLEMEATWTGSIHSKQYGIMGYGSDTEIMMNAGSIANHLNRNRSDVSNSIKTDYYAGVYLKGGKFTMNGGVIEGNSSNLGGSGVYVDQGAEFYFKQGIIQKNQAKAESIDSYGNSYFDATKYSLGIGVYIASGASMYMGIEGSSDHESCKITEHLSRGKFRGIGVYIDTNGSFCQYSGTISKNEGNVVNNMSDKSQGAGVANLGKLEMKDGIITHNGAVDGGQSGKVNNIAGAGLYLGGSSQTLSGGTISYNHTGSKGQNADSTYSGGGGIYIEKKAILSNLIIEQNYSFYGAGIAFRNVGIDENIITNCTIRNNTSQVISGTVLGFGQGGGIYAYTAKLTLDNVTIQDNTAQNGGAIYIQSNHQINIRNNSLIEKNTATGGSGGGIYLYATLLRMSNSTIKENRATSNGGGVLAESNGSIIQMIEVNILNNYAGHSGAGIYTNIDSYLRQVLFDGNSSGKDGGALYQGAQGTLTKGAYLRNCQIKNNTAAENGGGIFSASIVSITEESGLEATVISGNKANKGGGIYHAPSNGLSIHLDIAGVLQNSAVGTDAQGNNLYVNQMGLASQGISVYLYSGFLKQPPASQSGVYNVYMNSTGNGFGRLVIDPSMSHIDGTEAVYLNSTNNYMVYLTLPTANQSPKIPITVNPEKFTSGSVIVKPIGSGSAAKISFPSLNDATTGIANLDRQYNLSNAASSSNDINEGIAYVSGGKLPLRMGLDKYQDGNLTNVILQGRGVYLDGTKGNDSNTGLSPGQAVKTYEEAVKRLEKYTNESNSNAADTEGFPPFIYICGQVIVNTSAEWKLDHTLSMYSSLTESRYCQVETNAGRIPESAQVRRFNSYVNLSMIQIRGAGTVLTIPDLIVNGMSDSVSVQDQAGKSPIFQVEGATLILADKAHIRNNYQGVIQVDQSGKLQIRSNTADSETFTNQQVEVNRGDGIRLLRGSTMQMDGFASIIFPNVPNAMSTIAGYGIALNIGRGVIVENGSQLTMNDHSKITFTGVEEPRSSNVIGVVIGSSTYASNKSYLTMKEDSVISNCIAGIALMDYHSEIKMRDKSALKDNNHGFYSNNRCIGNILIEMADSASIYNSDEERAVNGFSLNNPGSPGTNVVTPVKIHLKDYSSIKDMANSGIYIKQNNTQFEIIMDKYALIDGDATYGIHLDQTIKSVTVTMNEYSKIVNSRTASIHTNSSTGSGAISAVKIFLNGNAMIGSEQLPYLTNTGISALGLRGDFELHMSTESAIKNCKTNGVNINQSTNKVTINMDNQSSIRNSNYGINYSRVKDMVITMKGDAAILDNQRYGIYMFYASSQFELKMEGNARIGATNDGQSHTGVYLNNTDSTSLTGEKSDKYHIVMSVNAMIGGDGAHDSTASSRGHSYDGIYTQFPINLEMSGNSKIKNNDHAGINLAKHWNITEYNYGKTKIKMGGYSEITNSTYGIYSVDKKLINATYGITEVITLSGNSAIKNVIEGNHFLSNSDVYLLDHAFLAQPTAASLDQYTIQINGHLHMDGTTKVEGIIYLMNAANPISLISPVPSSDPPNKYKLYLKEAFVGQIVVKPYAPSIVDPDLPTPLLTDVSPFLPYFNKAKADGMAADKSLGILGVNIVLTGGKHVYLSVNGNNNNSGLTPSTAVRTFNKAREILQSGLLGPGSNILICSGTTDQWGTPLVILAGDEDWSFDEGGELTDQNNKTWKPVITRDEQYYGTMLQIDSGTSSGGLPTASAVKFENITVDAMALQSLQAADRPFEKQILKISQGEAVLGEGAIFCNNQMDYSSNLINDVHDTTLGVRVGVNGTFIMDGGEISNLKQLNLRNNAGATYNHNIGLAIYNEGKVEIRKGIIKDNHLDIYCDGNVDQDYLFYEAMVLNVADSKFFMSGGMIQKNEVSFGTFSNIYGGALVMAENSISDISGGVISENRGGKGAAIFYASTQPMEIGGGRVKDNTTIYNNNHAIGEFSPIYIAQSQFLLKGGDSILDDGIYLNSTQNIIAVSNYIYQISRRYKVYINQGDGSDQFKKGSVVVQPDSNFIKDASQFLINFDVRSNPCLLDRGQSTTKIGGTRPNTKENQCLVLMQGVYLDGKKGSDTANDGSTPNKAVATFDTAKDIGEGSDKTAENRDYYIIYFSGPAYPEDNEEWNLPETAYMCRYTGFQIYHEDGALVNEYMWEYHNYLIEPTGTFTLGDIRIYGRRIIDDSGHNGDSMIRIKQGNDVKITQGTLLSRNYNKGNYIGESGIPTAVNALGGAAIVEVGGKLELNGGTITEVEDKYGTAIYQRSESGIGTTGIGQVKLDQNPGPNGENNSPHIEGGIFLDGNMDEAQAYIEVTDHYIPRNEDGTKGLLKVRLGSDYNGRPVVLYQDNVVPTEEQMGFYQLEDSIMAVYDMVRRTDNESILELRLRQILYINGQGGNDYNSGESPQAALATLKELYTRLQGMGESSGTLVFVVGTLDIKATENVTLLNERYEKNGRIYYQGKYMENDQNGNAIPSETIAIDSQVYFKRYSRPENYTNILGYDVDPNLGNLFNIKAGGNLTLQGIFIDGHSVRSVSNLDYLNAPSVPAIAPLVTVNPGAVLEISYGQTQTITGNGANAQNGLTSISLLTNNLNTRNKKIEPGKFLGISEEGDPVYEGSSAGVEILSDGSDVGKVQLKRVEFRNLVLGQDVDGGTDVYQNGELTVQEKTIFEGTVLLEGIGNAASRSTSRFLKVGAYGMPFNSNFNLLIRDAYNTRKVVEYRDSNPSGPVDTDIGYYLLEEKVNRYYALHKRATPERHVLELTVPKAVYVDGGNNGDDSHNGYTPNAPVKTLKKAYERLKESSGKVIYVVGTVEIDRNTEISAVQYQSGGDIETLAIGTDHVDIRRFVKPTIGEDPNTPGNPANPNYNEDYNVDDFEGTLFKVTNGATLTIKEKVYFDGHYYEKDNIHYAKQFQVKHTTKVRAPLIEVAANSMLKLQDGSSLKENYNTKDLSPNETRIPGGAIKNDGFVELSGGIIEDNEAAKGAGIYQNGTFDILANPEGIKGQKIYLTTENTGTILVPVWGVDHVVRTAAWLADDLKLDLDMERAVPGRPVIKYTAHTSVDSQWERYKLGSTVPNSLFLVEAETDSSLLELQNWEILDVSIPQEIFLAIQQTRTAENLVRNAASDETMLASPIYTIKNNGRYETKISLSGFINQNTEAGITAHEVMNLVASPSDALSSSALKNDLYLAIRGTDQGDNFSAMPETSLFDFDVEGAKLQQLGILNAGEEAQYEFVAAAAERFMNQYTDSEFPFFGANAMESKRIAHFRHKNIVTSVTSANYARAKYRMSYRIELVPPRN